MSSIVMAGLVPAIHAGQLQPARRAPGDSSLDARRASTVWLRGTAWMAGTSPAMTGSALGIEIPPDALATANEVIE